MIKDIELHVLINNVSRHKVPIFRVGWGLLINEGPSYMPSQCDKTRQWYDIQLFVIQLPVKHFNPIYNMSYPQKRWKMRQWFPGCIDGKKRQCRMPSRTYVTPPSLLERAGGEANSTTLIRQWFMINDWLSNVRCAKK